MSRAKSIRRPPSWPQDFLGLLWRMPLIAVALSALMVVFTGAPWASWTGYLIPTATCTALAMTANLVLRHTAQPRIMAGFGDDPRANWVIAAMYIVTSMVAAFVGLLLLQLTLFPGMLGSLQQGLRILAYSLTLAVLATGITLSYRFYRRAMDRAGSDRELQLARAIQRSFLLTDFPARSRIEVHAENLSSRQVSGDFYDVVAAGDDVLWLAVADVSGKGVPAALLSSMVQASLRTQAGSVVSPATMVAAINRLACDRGATGQFVTVFLAVVDERDLSLRYTNAGHNHPVLLKAGGRRELLDEGGLLVGMMPAVEYMEGVRRLTAGDRLVIYTDGVSEAMDEDGTMYGEERLYGLLESLPRDLDARGIVERVLAGVRGFLGDVEPGDDITVMALRVLKVDLPEDGSGALSEARTGAR